MRNMRNILSTVFILLALTVNAQNFTGRIIDEQAQPMSFATISLLNSVDSTIIAGTVSNDDGTFSIQNTNNHTDGLLRISYIGYGTKYLDVKAGDVGTIQMQPNEHVLKEAVIKGHKPIIRQEHEKAIFDPKLIANIEAMKTFDVMKLAPGVIVMPNGKIQIAGKDAAVFVDDRQLSSDELTAYLKSLRTSDIDKIEITRNHGGVNDASIAGGVVNIITQKKRMGFDGTADIYASTPKIGFYHHTSTMNFFFGRKQWNLYGMYSYTQDRSKQYNETTNNYLYNNTKHYSVGTYLSNLKEHLYHIGATYSLTPRHTLGLELNGISLSPTTDRGQNAQTYYILEQAYQGNAYQTYLAHSDFYNIVASYSWNIDERNSNLKFLLNYSNKKSLSDNELDSKYSSLSKYDVNERDITHSNGHGTSATLDFRKNYVNGWSIRLGGKIQNSKRISAFNSSDNLSGTLIDTNWNYKENIAGGYIGTSKEAGKWYLCGIMRMENTNVKGNAAGSNSVSKNYTDWIPYLYISYNTNRQYNYSLSYTRTIYRPPFSLMNGYVNRISDVLYDKGNPDLKAELTDVLEFSASYGRHSFAMTFRHKPNAITELFEVQDGITYHTNVNYGSESTGTMSYSYSGNILSWWQSNFYAAETYTSIPRSYNRKHLLGGQVNWNNRISLKNVGILSLDFYCTSPTIIGTSYQKGYATLDLTAEHSFLRNTLTLQIGVNDLFNGSKVRISNKVPTLDYNAYMKNQSQLVWCRLTFNFSTKVKVDENRIQNDNNIGNRL